MVARRQVAVLRIDDVVYPIKPGSLTDLRKGAGEAMVEVEMNGTDPVIVDSTDLSTQKSGFSFEMLNTPANIDLKDNLLLSRANHVVELIYTDGGSDVMTHAVLVNDPEEGLSQDGSLTLEFEGKKMI